MSSDENLAPFYRDFQLGVLENNFYIIFSTKNFHSRENHVPDLFVIDF
ncbi:hypothetical protein P4U03_26585 [Bacillus mycoides]|nr:MULTISPECIES: hypothetical protein [Bacillus cereus group]EJV55571.1 hypothetical protein IEM_05434 [Bacillus cereus BAG6O-2]MBJ8096004.1 hypothetical protein [Bacillus cereus]MCQ6358885.1 hypothetical protein [Bacillus cereus]MDM5465389.1 hypothetical protein [Bacillus cereus]MED1270067.1 hypothetical protein [Bacillus mycoides]